MTRELSEQARAMLERALAEERPLMPGTPRRAQLKRSLLQGAALAGAGHAAAAPAPPPLVASTAATKGALGLASLMPLAKGIGVGLLLSGGLLGGAQLFGASKPTPASTGTAHSNGAVTAVSAAPALVTTPAPASAAPSSDEAAAPAVLPARASSSDAASPAEAAPGLAAELQLMTAAQAALRDGQSAQALELLERYDRTFPQGQLLGERLAAEVFAACQLGNRARATRAAERFLQRDARSVLAGRVRRSCAFEPGGGKR